MHKRNYFTDPLTIKNAEKFGFFENVDGSGAFYNNGIRVDLSATHPEFVAQEIIKQVCDDLRYTNFLIS